MDTDAHRQGDERAGDHAQAVLFLCDHLAAAGHTVISANTDEAADPQIFAQSDAGELAFYFVRASAPSPADLARFRALAARHAVAAYRAAVSLRPRPRCLGMTPLR
jgi:hypothetical protein